MDDKLIKSQKGVWSDRLHHTVNFNRRASIAGEFVTKWGMVLGVPDGEDSAGRSRLRLATPTEVVDRAVETADLLMTRFDQLGWLTETTLSDDAD